MSFYGTSFYELKEYFKRFLFQNYDQKDLITFEPGDLFDTLKQKGDYWIHYDKLSEEQADGSQTDILLVSHNVPYTKDATIGGLHLHDNIDEVYNNHMPEHLKFIADSQYHGKILDVINRHKYLVSEYYDSLELEQLFVSLSSTFSIKDTDTYQDYLDYLGVFSTGYKYYYLDDKNPTQISYLIPKGPFGNKSNEIIIEDILSLFNPGTVATLPNYDIDQKGHLIFKGNTVFTFPDTVIGFVNPDNPNEIIKVGATDNPDGSYILFTSNGGYIDFSFNESTGALSINHKVVNNKVEEVESAMPKYYNSIEEVIMRLQNEGYNYNKDDLKIQSFRSGNILQIPNFKYDKYGHMIQDEQKPFNFFSLDMADSYHIVNYTVKFDSGWEMEQGISGELEELGIYKKQIPELTQHVMSEETVFNVACDNPTRLKLMNIGIYEFWVDNVEGNATMYIRGEEPQINTGNNARYGFQAQVVSSYDSAAAAEGINGAVIVSLAFTDINNFETPGVCTHSYGDIKKYLDQGKMVICHDIATQQYFVPYKNRTIKTTDDPTLINPVDGETVSQTETHPLYGDNYYIFANVTNKEQANVANKEQIIGDWITSTRIVIPENLNWEGNKEINGITGQQKVYIRTVNYNLGSKINDFVQQGTNAIDTFTNTDGKNAIDTFNAKANAALDKFENNFTDALEEAVSDLLTNKMAPGLANNLTLDELKACVNEGKTVYYSASEGLIPLTYINGDGSKAIFSINSISGDTLTIKMYYKNADGSVTSESFAINKKLMLPSGGSNGQILMMGSSGAYWANMPTIPVVQKGTNDIGAGASLGANTLYLVYE